MRGDDPDVINFLVEIGKVCPACAGMIRLHQEDHEPSESLPRMRGDDPLPLVSSSSVATFAPHARG